MDFKNFPEEIKVDESFDEFGFWCKLLGASHAELVNMPEEEIKQRMDKAQNILIQHHKQEKVKKIEQQNRLDFLQKLYNTFEKFKENESNQELSKVIKEKLKLKLRELMRERGGSDIVNLLVKAAAEVSESFEDNTCFDSFLDAENFSKFPMEASSNNQGNHHSRSTKGLKGNSELFQNSNVIDNSKTRSISSSGGASSDGFAPPSNNSFNLGGNFNKTQGLGDTFDKTQNLGGAFNKTQNFGGTFNKLDSRGAPFDRPSKRDGTFNSNSVIQEAFHGNESFDRSRSVGRSRSLDRSRRSHYDSRNELNRAGGISSPFNTNPRLVSSPVTRYGLNRVGCEFQEGRVKHYQSCNATQNDTRNASFDAGSPNAFNTYDTFNPNASYSSPNRTGNMKATSSPCNDATF